jgi:hypothetical protein
VYRFNFQSNQFGRTAALPSYDFQTALQLAQRDPTLFAKRPLRLIRWTGTPGPVLYLFRTPAFLPNLNLDALIILHRQFVSNPQLIDQMGLVRRLPCGSACPKRKVGEASRFALA